MAGTKEIKSRIKSVKNTKKITKAMELVSASKMKRAITATLAARPYSGYSWQVLQALSEHVDESKNPLLEVREVKRLLVVLITSNRSLCGGYNAQMIRKTIAFIREHEGTPIDFIAVGSKGEAALRRMGQNVIASFTDISDKPTLADMQPISNLVIDLYKQKEYDRVLVGFTDFRSALMQVPEISVVLPVKRTEMLESIEGAVLGQGGDTGKKIEYIFEPDYETLMSIIVEKVARVRMLQMVLESSASEHSARMMAMKNASDAAGEMIDDLTLAFNKARQASITQEISEISAGMASVT